mgnify:CR=1 FL=1
MIRLVIPKLEDLWFREKLIGNEETMAYNKKWSGTIDFPKISGRIGMLVGWPVLRIKDFIDIF